MKPLKTSGLFVWRSPFVLMTRSAALCMVMYRERPSRLLAPVIFSILPKKHIGEFFN